jgi:hypothetical protein
MLASLMVSRSTRWFSTEKATLPSFYLAALRSTTAETKLLALTGPENHPSDIHPILQA